MFENIQNCLTFVEWPEKIKKKIDNNYNLFFKYNFKSEKRFLEFRNNLEDIFVYVMKNNNYLFYNLILRYLCLTLLNDLHNL